MKKNIWRNIGIYLVIILILITLTVSLVLNYKINQTNNQTSINDSDPQKFEDVNSFQLSRYNEIREAIFGKTSNYMFYDGIENLPVIEGNKYFNWTNTTDLGITPWNGTTNDAEGNPLTWSHFTGGEDTIEALSAESNTYTDSYIDGATGNEVTKNNSIDWYVIDVYTAEELRWILTKVSSDTSGNSYKVNINQDIDLNGKNFDWTSIYLTNKANLYIEGNGHTIYNLKNKQHGFFGSVSDTSLIVKNLEFDSSMVISTSDMIAVLCGSLQKSTDSTSTGIFFENIHIKNAFVRASQPNVGTLIGRTNGVENKNIFIKKCLSQNSIIVGTGHLGGLVGCQNNRSTNYKVKYDAKFPEVPESFFKDIIYPEMIEDCYSIDCEIFSTTEDSGAFISCGGKLIVRNCFTNNTIYANEKTGVFIGREVGNHSGSNGLYDDNGKRTINSYFENCYASGIIEGASRIGGFIGFIETSKENGVSIFKNCYSTSMVGMEYSGEALGGFIGDDTTPSQNSVTLKLGDETKEFYGSVFINCYAAGEVGNITTNTDNTAENTNTVGGFIGTYTSHKSNMINCFYDKQTTGMRERAMGYRVDNSTGQIEGVTGVYTKGSTLENGTAGLTGKTGNIIDMQDDNAWVQCDGLYPQLRVFTEATNFDTDKDNVKAYSQASASTVFLDHWDYIMTKDNQTYNIQTEDDYTPTAKAEENNYIYDTIRDITLKFELTSNENSEHTYSDITWYVDSEMNSSRELLENYTINYGETSVIGEDKFDAPVLTILNPAKDSENIDPELLQLMQSLGDTKDIYKCYEFAPGKNWVSLEVKNDDGTVTGKRKLRLLPIAYVDAGNYAEIEIDAEGNNIITYKNSDGKQFSYDGENYNHYLDTLYTTTSRENLGTSDNYKSQEVSKDSNTQFAMWGRYPAEENKLDSTSRFDALYSNAMIGDSTEGLTKVEVYKLDVEYVETTLENGQKTQLPKINYDNERRITEEKLDNEKWTGMVNFGAEDAGWYELKYYWRLNDGRYLYDSKIIVIKGEAHDAIIENKIYNKDVETTPEIMPDIKQNENEPANLIFDGSDVDETIGVTDTITRTKEIQNFSGEEILLGWKNDGNYKLVDLSIEVSQDGTNWTPLVLKLNNPDNPYDFINAKYTYYYQDYKMLQNPNTKEFYLMAIDDPKEITTEVTPIAKGENPDYAKYLYLSFFIKEDDDSIKSVRSDVRVKASFVPMDTHVVAKKYVDKENVLTGEDVTYTVIMEDDYFTDAFDINASDIIPENTEYIADSIEVGEYIEDTDTYIPDTEKSYTSSAYDDSTRELSWHYDKMQYGKKYYAKFKVNVTGVVDKLTQDFIKVDNVVNFTYRKSEFGSKVNGEPSKAATFIIIQDERVYLVIDKEITTDNAPLAKFKMDSSIIKEGLDLEKYKWYVNYEQISDTSASVEINQDEVAMLVGKTSSEENLNGAYYKIAEDLDAMPANYYFSSITNNGEGVLEAGKVKKVTVNNYYQAPSDQINIFVEKRDIDTNEYVANAKVKIQKADANDVYNDYLIWDTKATHKTISLSEGKYRIVEESAPEEYILSDEELYFEIVRNESGNLLVLKDGQEVENKFITFYNERIKYDCTIKYFYDGVEDTSKEEHLSMPKDSVVTEYTDKVKTGYRLMTTEEGEQEGIAGLKDGVVGLPLTITNNPENNIINVYYVKRNDLSYTINYLEAVTNKVIHEPKTQGGMTFEDVIKAEDEAIDIEGYNYDYPDKYELVIGIDENVINIYYSKVTGLGYKVNYLEKGTDKVLFPSNNQGNMTFGDVVVSSDEIIPIDGYVYDSVDKETLIIGTGENVINIYYTKRTDLSYTVNYLEKDTNSVLHDSKTVENVTFESVITSHDEVIAIDGYNYDSVDKDTLTTTTGENVINIYYTKKADLSYMVNYLEKDTNKVLQPAKTVNNAVFDEVINSSDEVVEIDGYNYDSVDKATLTITTGENVINIYYTKRTDLSYKVNYLEKNTNIILNEQKVVENKTLEEVITSSDEVIEIDGYNYDSVDKDTLTITTGENVINIYYTKRTDLSYKVNYLEKDTDIVLHDSKTVENVIFESVITSQDEVIAIDGYNYDSVDKDTLTITIGENVINIYYTKRADLSYTVNYLEKDTNKVIHSHKTVNDAIFGEVINSNDEIIQINGYGYDSVDKDTLTITTGLNEINIYYTKINGLAYTVNYLELGTDLVIHEPKVQDEMTFEDEIVSSDEVIEIDGYNYDSVDKDTLIIGTGENVINIYYTKRTDLSYTVNYLEKDTNKVIHEERIVNNATFDEVISSSDEVIDIDGYNYDSVDKDTLIIGTGENVINIYYTKRNDLSYTVNYLEKDTNRVLHDSKTVENVTFESVITSSDEVIEILGYNYDSVDKETLSISTGLNEINIYYTKKDTKVTVHYYEEGTTNKVSEDVVITGKVFSQYVTTAATDVPSKYELVAVPANSTGEMTEEEIVVIYYYRKKATQVIVHHYEEGTTNKLSENVTIDGRIDDPYTTQAATDVPIKYELVAEPVNKTGTMTEDVIEVTYYYRVKDAILNVRYLEKGTDQVLADPEQQTGKVDEQYITTEKPIEGYTLVENSGNTTGILTVEPITVTFYYLQNTSVTVNHIDKTTGEILSTETKPGLVGDEFTATSKALENYVLVEKPSQETVTMTKTEIILNYYYIHISGGVIEKHIDVISGEILANESYEGNEGDPYNIPSRTFAGYDLVEDRLPVNSQGTMQVNPIEVTYYYIYRTKVTVKYVDKATGEKLAPTEVQTGYEADRYTTERKIFDDYKLVEVPTNADGEMTKEEITVTYYYVHTSGGVIVNHVDVNTGKQLKDETKQEGYEGDPYETHEENIPNYDLVQEKYPTNSKGTMTKEPTRVTYYYVKKTEVTVKYVDSETGEEIEVPETIPGHEGDDYNTNPKEIPGYDLTEEPENKDGKMTNEPTEVVYYYKRPAKVVVRYLDEETKEELATEEKIEGHQNDNYTTVQKEINYYNLVEVPNNWEGKMTVTAVKDETGNEVVEDTTYVTYYYRKKIFNLKVDKQITSIIVNGEERPVNGNLGKVELNRTSLSTTSIQVVYKIVVTNNSELKGKTVVLENIPEGMTMRKENNEAWEINEEIASLVTDEIQPGESREYKVMLDWVNDGSNIGTKENIAQIVKSENEAGFEEKDIADDESSADLIISVGTGIGVKTYAIGGGITLIILSAISVVVIKKKRKDQVK